jgi:hypothetical protein
LFFTETRAIVDQLNSSTLHLKNSRPERAVKRRRPPFSVVKYPSLSFAALGRLGGVLSISFPFDPKIDAAVTWKYSYQDS